MNKQDFKKIRELLTEDDYIELALRFNYKDVNSVKRVMRGIGKNTKLVNAAMDMALKNKYELSEKLLKIKENVFAE